jgi:hypothetical protein
MLCVQYVHLTNDQSHSPETDSFTCQRGCYIRTMTARVQSQKKETLVVNLMGLGARTNWLAQTSSRKGTLTLTLSWLVSQWVRELLQFSRGELFLLEAGSWGRGNFGNPEEGVTKQRQWRRHCEHSGICNNELYSLVTRCIKESNK